MSEKFIVAGRKSKLSQAQISLFTDKLTNSDISSTVEYIQTYGDTHTELPINQLPITNPFTKEIHQALLGGTIDVGVSSLKDVEISETQCIETVYFSERENPRDILILSQNTVEKIKHGDSTINIGTSSKRRQFLFGKIASKILSNNTKVKFQNIRGNITTRIALVQKNKLDGIVIAMAGVLRLRKNDNFKNEIASLLSNTMAIVLPISHFPTPPGQGVIIGQVSTSNQKDFSKIKALSNINAERISRLEKQEFFNYGKGCKEGYGVTHLSYKNHECTFINGVTSKGKEINICKNFAKPKYTKLFDTRSLRDCIKKIPINAQIPKGAKKFIVANANAVNSQELIGILKEADEVWAIGFMTLQKLTQMGVLCNGCLESLGIEAFDDVYFSSTFETLTQEEYYILTYKTAKLHSNYNTIATYYTEIDVDLSRKLSELSSCDAVVWSSVLVYENFKQYFKGNVHITLLGETYNRLVQDGINPFGIFNFDVLSHF
jgi:hydroxymethylbilane synthase